MINYSLELFPPRRGSPDLLETLKQACDSPVPPPTFVSITCRYGCEAETLRQATQLQQAGYRTAAHMLHHGHSQHQLRQLAGQYYRHGIRHIVALRGDLDADNRAGKTDGFLSTVEFVAALRNWHPDLEISVAGYPDVHPEAKNWRQDLSFLEQKTAAGADQVLTQLFFSPNLFLRYLNRARHCGIDTPIVPGLMPITEFAKVLRFTRRCQVSVPGYIHRLFALDGDRHQRHLLAMSLLASQVQRLHSLGVNHFHFYMLNTPLLLRPLLHWLSCCQDTTFSPGSALAIDPVNLPQ